MARAAGQVVLPDAAVEPAAAGISQPPDSSDPWSYAPFDHAAAAEIRALVERLAPGQRLWLSGYLAGGLAHTGKRSLSTAAKSAVAPVMILFGSQSGNSQRLANELAQRLGVQQTASRVVDMLDCRKTDLEQAQRLVVIISTQGDGDPPDRAVPLFELLSGRKAPRFSQTQFAVLALGDSSYEHYCAAGRRIDAQLETLGARRLLPRVDCDVDFEVTATAWIDTIAGQLADAVDSGSATSPAHARSPAPLAQAWTRKNPFVAEILANQGLTARGSTKEVRHLELSLVGSGMQYKPGDALGIVPRNDSGEVEALLSQLGFDADAQVPAGDSDISLNTALIERCEIGALTAAFVRRYAEATHHTELIHFARHPDVMERYLRGRDLRDLVAEHPPRGLDAPAFVRLLSPLAQRLYSIASSAKATPEEIHLTIGVVTHESHGRSHRGVVSGAVAKHAEGDSLPVYLHRNEGFRLPADPQAAIVMIGAGTGVAPYRSFLAEREAIGATGRSWLVFGDRSFELDFLYQADWLAWRKRSLLTRLDVAFSRDRAEKIYVQHRLREHGPELWRWLQDGAHLYVCGDAQRMAPDVERELLDVSQRHGGLDDEAAREYLLQLQRERRYQKDVY